MSASARTAVAAPAPATRSLALPLAGLLAVGLLVRLAFLPSLGFHNDISAFEAWALALRDNPPWEFYSKTTFADYPPGYFLVLWFIGRLYGLLGNLHLISLTDGSYFALRILVKLPALAMDLVDTVLIFALVRRYASGTIALGAAALFALNPATIYVSAYWGQIDSVAWGMVLGALYLAVRSNEKPAAIVPSLAAAWVLIAFSILVKPQGLLVAAVLLAYPFTAGDAAVTRKRLIGTGLGLGIGVVIAYLVSALFHGSLDPVADFAWLFERYRFGSAVYPYNSINAFNLYAIKQPFWQSDLAALSFFGLPFGAMWAWGIALVAAASVLIVTRYLQLKSERAFLEAAMLVAFAFFILATRMHERYIYGAFILAFPLVAFGRRGWWPAIVISLTTLLNLTYSLAYQAVMETRPANIDATNIWPVGSHLVAAVNVALFFVLGYLYLGGTITVFDGLERDAHALGLRARAWFDPREGIAAMTRRDWLYAGLFTLASLIVCLAWIQWPTDKIFDEIYYARAGEEYLKHVDIFEFTHPPLTKLIIAFSMILAGKIDPAWLDVGIGWRFLNVVVGALMVGVIYAFGKRLTGSTLFAAVAAAMLLFDGFHFVQSRIATPEITVAFFSLTTLYAFYRVWTASAARRAATLDFSRPALLLGGGILAVGLAVAAGAADFAMTFGPSTKGDDLKWAAFLVVFLWVETIFYLVARWAISDRRGTAGDRVQVSYADGSRRSFAANGATALLLPEGETVPVSGGKGAQLTVRDDGDAQRRYQRDGRLIYATPAVTATFDPSPALSVEGTTEHGSQARRWLVLLAISGGALAASKWNGLFDFFVVWCCVAGVAAQRFLRRPALYGNPFGMPLDVVIGLMFAIAGAMYTLAYIPFFTLGHNFVDMVTLQREMYHYHATLVATHPYASQWWQWPILERPISYFYAEYPPYQTTKAAGACCVAEILALPNPFVWWAGLLTVPIVGVLAWTERNRGYALLVVAYFLQWLPWIGSPRIAFEYHFFPNLAIIILANTIVLQRIWNWRPAGAPAFAPRLGVAIYLAVVAGGFVFFYPVLAGVHVTWDAWHARMWIPRWII